MPEKRVEASNDEVTDAMVKYIGRDDLVGLDDPYLHKLAAIWLEHRNCHGCRKCKAIPDLVEQLFGALDKRKPKDPFVKLILETCNFLDMPMSVFGIRHDAQTIAPPPH
ncbi:hypothetical protein HJO_06650 [Hyphomonas johnsonii MHS-2]|uniref:Uncharacterized protein n=2 Tax=Hyphomonas johnsonii TaxID=81031 RepID=A0A059FST9_9PROT|nr:hypothetical protein HJO_06650 [Hyphomonas johnsonii MHS-2]